MQARDEERQRAEAIRSAPHHLQLQVEHRGLPTPQQLREGNDVAWFEGTVLTMFRSHKNRLCVGSTLRFEIEHCIPEELLHEFGIIGDINVFSDNLATANTLEIILDKRLRVTCGLIETIEAQSSQPHLAEESIRWMAD